MSYFLETSILVIHVEQPSEPSVIASFHAMKTAYASILKIVHSCTIAFVPFVFYQRCEVTTLIHDLETGNGGLRNKKKYLEL